MHDIPRVITPDELYELIDLVNESYGFDLSGYSKASLKRRLLRIMQLKNLKFYELKDELINNKAFFQVFIDEITVNVTEMFRDPNFYKAVNKQVIPCLASYSNPKVWCAGCSTGEEVYSLAILLNRAGLYEKSFIHGTDINSQVLQEARKGIYTLRKVKSYAENYQVLGLDGSITDNFTILNEVATINDELKHNTSFSVHNLVSDGVFNEFQFISCRNVFIYFEVKLQEQILDIFYKSLAPNGFLCLGTKETIRSGYFKEKFKPVNLKENIYQKVDN